MVHTKGSGFMWVPRRWDCAYLLTRSMSTMSGTGVSTTRIKGAAIEGVTEDSKDDADAGTGVNTQTDTEPRMVLVGSDVEVM